MNDMTDASDNASDAAHIHVPQAMKPGDVVDDRGLLVAVLGRSKLGKKLTIARCTVDEVRGQLAGGLERDEFFDLVAMDACARTFAPGCYARPRHYVGKVVIEAAKSRSGRRVARVLRYDGPAPVRVAVEDTRIQAPKINRAEVFAKWLDLVFGRARLEVVVDVAGGKGAVAAALLRRGASIKATVIDPVGRPRSHGEKIDADEASIDAAIDACIDDEFARAVQLLREPFAYPPSEEAQAILQGATCIVAMHPDEATEAAVCAAASAGLPWAVVPCCIFASKFPYRRQFWQFDPADQKRGVKDWDTFCTYLGARAAALGCSDVRTATLALVGRNRVVYSLGAKTPSYATWPGDCVVHVAAFLPLEDLCLSAPRCVDRTWRFDCDRSLRPRLDEVRAEIARADGRLTVAAEPPTYRLRNLRPPSDPSTVRMDAVVRRVANAAELRRVLGETGHGSASASFSRRALRIVAAVHSIAVGPAYVWLPHEDDVYEAKVPPAIFVERAQLYVEAQSATRAAMDRAVAAAIAAEAASSHD